MCQILRMYHPKNLYLPHHYQAYRLWQKVAADLFKLNEVQHRMKFIVIDWLLSRYPEVVKLNSTTSVLVLSIPLLLDIEFPRSSFNENKFQFSSLELKN